jgi:hypothetical protein
LRIIVALDYAPVSRRTCLQRDLQDLSRKFSLVAFYVVFFYLTVVTIIFIMLDNLSYIILIKARNGRVGMAFLLSQRAGKGGSRQGGCVEDHPGALISKAGAKQFILNLR